MLTCKQRKPQIVIVRLLIKYFNFRTFSQKLKFRSHLKIEKIMGREDAFGKSEV